MNSEHNWFYVPPEYISRSNIVFPEETVRHIVHVLRKKADDTIFVTDGQGNLYTARMMRVQRSSCKAEILEKRVNPAPKPPYLDLAFVPLKGSRTEIVIEKGKELGVRRYLLFISQYGVIKQLKSSKMERYKHVMISAMVQSRQCTISPVLFFNDTRSLVREFKGYDQVLIADPSGVKRPAMKSGSVLLVIGPEGGFDRDELFLFDQTGAKGLSLGTRRLRSETAAIAGVVKILTRYGVM